MLKRRLRVLPIVSAALLSVLSASVTAAERVALVVGNATYAHAPHLANPLNDAADIGAALQRLGFTVDRLDNADKAELERALHKLSQAATGSGDRRRILRRPRHRGGQAEFSCTGQRAPGQRTGRGIRDGAAGIGDTRGGAGGGPRPGDS